MSSEISYINGMNLGLGFNSSTLDIHPVPALDNISTIRRVVNANGQEVLFRIEMASSTLSLSEQLSVSARASLKYGITASGSAKTSFLSSFKQNSYSVYIIVQVLVTNEQTLLDMSQIKLRPEAASLFRDKPDEFVQQYGDSFVYGLTTGGEFIGILEIESSSASEYREVKASLSGKANYGLFSGSASASFSRSIEKITSSYSMKGAILRKGSVGAISQITPDAFVKEALEFPAKVMGDNGFAYTALIVPYNHIPHPGAAPLDTANQMLVLEQLGTTRQRFLKYQNDLSFALDHQEQFPGIDPNAISARFNLISNEVNKIVDTARGCFIDKTSCSLPSIDLSLLGNILPPQINLTNQKNMITGTVRQSWFQTSHPMETANPVGVRRDTVHVSFPSGKFNATPKVEVMLSMIDAANTANTRLDLSAADITSTGFNLVITTWADSKIYGIAAAWIAYME